MDNSPSPLRLAIMGGSALVVGIAGMWAANADGDLLPRIAYALASIVYGIPIVIAVSCFGGLAVHYHQWREERQPKQGGAVSVAGEAPKVTPPAATLLSEAWRVYWIGWLEYADKEGGITFTKTARYFGTKRAAALQTWREVVRPFIRAGMVDPVVERETTGWVVGFTSASVAALLRTGQNIDPRYIPPYSPPRAFESLPVEQGETAETSPKQAETGSAVFARDVER